MAVRKNAVPGLHEAARDGDEKKVRDLLAAGADVDALSKSVRWSPLMDACFMGYWQVAGVLLDAGADVHLSNRMGQVALSVAVHGASMAPDVKPHSARSVTTGSSSACCWTAAPTSTSTPCTARPWP